jgi:hypothetical protein
VLSRGERVMFTSLPHHINALKFALLFFSNKPVWGCGVIEDRKSVGDYVGGMGSVEAKVCDRFGGWVSLE